MSSATRLIYISALKASGIHAQGVEGRHAMMGRHSQRRKVRTRAKRRVSRGLSRGAARDRFFFFYRRARASHYARELRTDGLSDSPLYNERSVDPQPPRFRYDRDPFPSRLYVRSDSRRGVGMKAELGRAKSVFFFFFFFPPTRRHERGKIYRDTSRDFPLSIKKGERKMDDERLAIFSAGRQKGGRGRGRSFARKRFRVSADIPLHKAIISRTSVARAN